MRRSDVLTEVRRARIAVNVGSLVALVSIGIWSALAGAPHVHLGWLPITFVVAFYAGTIRGAATMVINALEGPDA